MFIRLCLLSKKEFSFILIPCCSPTAAILSAFVSPSPQIVFFFGVGIASPILCNGVVSPSYSFCPHVPPPLLLYLEDNAVPEIKGVF